MFFFLVCFLFTTALAVPNHITGKWFYSGDDSIGSMPSDSDQPSDNDNGTTLSTILTELPTSTGLVSALATTPNATFQGEHTIHIWLVYNDSWIGDLWVPQDEQWHQVSDLPCQRVNVSTFPITNSLYQCNRIPFHWAAYEGGTLPNCTLEDHVGMNYTLASAYKYKWVDIQTWGYGFLVQVCCGQNCADDPEAPFSQSASGAAVGGQAADKWKLAA